MRARPPKQWLVDGGFPAHEQIDAVAGKTELYAPVPKSKPPKPKDEPKDAPKGELDGPASCHATIAP